MDPRQNDLFIAFRRYIINVIDDVLCGYATYGPARIWDNTICTEHITTVLYLYSRACLFKKISWYRLTIFTRIDTRILFFCLNKLLDQIRYPRTVMCPGYDISVSTLFHSFKIDFGKTSAYNNNALRMFSFIFSDQLSRFSFTFIRHRACIDNYNIRIFRRNDLIPLRTQI